MARMPSVLPLPAFTSFSNSSSMASWCGRFSVGAAAMTMSMASFLFCSAYFQPLMVAVRKAWTCCGFSLRYFSETSTVSCCTITP